MRYLLMVHGDEAAAKEAGKAETEVGVVPVLPSPIISLAGSLLSSRFCGIGFSRL
jgi:hypothetical protein